VKFNTEQQNEINRIISDRLAEQKRQIEESARRSAEEKAAQEKGEWKQLAESRKADLEKAEATVKTHEKTIRTQKERITALEGTLQGYVDAEKRTLSPMMAAADPEHDDPVKELQWLTKVKAATAGQQPAPAAPPPQSPAPPAPQAPAPAAPPAPQQPAPAPAPAPAPQTPPAPGNPPNPPAAPSQAPSAQVLEQTEKVLKDTGRYSGGF
jgi:hypothetical protein